MGDLKKFNFLKLNCHKSQVPESRPHLYMYSLNLSKREIGIVLVTNRWS